jgi:predicted protein tyrosine phosphatase
VSKSRTGLAILVTDRSSIEQGFVVKSSYALISICDSDARRACIPKVAGLRGILHLSFDDAEPLVNARPPAHIKLMSAAEARRIWRFVDKYKANVGAFVVHCHQGMSRSPAVAAALAVYLGADEKPFWREYSPNEHVYRLLREAMPLSN